MKKTVVSLLVVLLVTPFIYTLNARTTPSLTNLVGQMGDSSVITFIVNTAFVQDTVSDFYKNTVSIRGSGIFGDWSYDEGVKLTNIGGDYWMGTLTTDQNNSGGAAKVVTSTNSGTGWDRVEIAPFDIEGDETIEIFTSGLKVNYPDPVTGDTITRGIDWNPLEIAKGETNNIAVHFRVNFEDLQTFPRNTAEVYVRGSMLDDSWSVLPEGRLYPEVRHDDLCCGAGIYEADKHFYSRTVLVDPSKAGKNLEYKFTFNSAGSTTWEEISNRKVTLSGNDTTLAWVWWNNQRVICICEPAIYDINFEVDLFNAINTNGFDPAKDNVVVRAGYAASGPKIQEVQLDAPLFGTVYNGTLEAFEGVPNKYVAYKYLRIRDGVEQEEYYYDFLDETGTTTGPKYRKISTPVDTSGILIASDLLDDPISTHRTPFFRNTDSVGVPTILRIEADMRSAHYTTKTLGGELNDILGGPLKVTAANIDTLPVFIHGPASRWGWWLLSMTPWYPDSVQLFDDGVTYGDAVAGDLIYTIEIPKNATSQISQEFQLSIGYAANETGLTFNHVANLFAKPLNVHRVQFGVTDPNRYFIPDKGSWFLTCESGNGFCVGVENETNKEVTGFRLQQNYPNPFNPSTMIPFTVAKAGVVNFTVYNVLGQEVAAFDAEVPSAGTHQIPFTARNLASGTYLVKLQVGNHTDIIRILLTK
ncbi:MAG: T9SS type A sorting domain-containing protein [Bacteroidetes bacterium]|nr:T9SS type A sorting domain-containing protein [Bacteroidota bacterium]